MPEFARLLRGSTYGQHQGEHPRIGATDVVPFVPLEDSTMDDCVELARELGERVGKELGIPVLSLRARGVSSRRERISPTSGADSSKDFATSSARIPSASLTSARTGFTSPQAQSRSARVRFSSPTTFTSADASNLALAKSIAKQVRESSGGFKAVKGLGLEVDGQAQVSMNLVDTDQTPLHIGVRLHHREKARAEGVDVTWSEIIGLVPEKVLFEASKNHLKLDAVHA